ncbi:MAG: ATPase, partial [Kiritimatiellae bacterium]|nr:ATPase [Kiritimatiellia bacterium]
MKGNKTMKETLGIELGSTRIKAVIIGDNGSVIASGAFSWANRALSEHVWTYDLADARAGVAAAYAACATDYAARRGARPARFDAMGVSAMMHGYLAFDAAGDQLAPFRTWRSTNAAAAGAELSALLGVHVPARWSVAQLYQSVLDGEDHVRRIAFQTTLAGYVHFLLTGRKVLGMDDASGMFPVDALAGTYDARLAGAFKAKTGLDVTALFPAVLKAGEDAGVLTEAGARLLDPSGTLRPGIPLCPPEGDAGTGMVATNAVRPGTGNVSVGTSVFAMVVLDKPIAKTHPHIDFVSTPSGDDVAMVHCNTGCGELDRWVALFGGDYGALLREALEEGEPDCGGVRATNWIAAEPLA